MNKLEEFAYLIEKLNKEPLEKQVNALHKVVFEMTNFFQSFVYNFNTELSNIHNKITSLEAKKMITAVSHPPMSPKSLNQLNQPKPNGKGLVPIRSAILNELKALFEKHSEKNGSVSE